ncbi:MAG: hypothetical protein ACXQT0_01710 [Candidatus Methanofastidiosia archaeon]
MPSNKNRLPVSIKPKHKIVEHLLVTRRKYALWGSLLGALCLCVVVGVLPLTSKIKAQPSSNIPLTATIFQAERSLKTLTATPSSGSIFVLPTATHKTSPTRTAKPTQLAKCSGADWMPQSKIKPEVIVQVCTKVDRLIVHKDHYDASTEIFRIYPKAEVSIISGPYCADGSWWWEINIPIGTKYAKGPGTYDSFRFLTRETTGYVREGRDNVDKYFICP